MSNYDPKAQKKVRETINEIKHDELRAARGGKKVPNPRQSVGVGLDEARQEGARIPNKAM